MALAQSNKDLGVAEVDGLYEADDVLKAFLVIAARA